MPSTRLTGAAAAAGIAIINSVGNLGGYLGPFVLGFIKDETGDIRGGLYFLATSLVLTVVLMTADWRTQSDR